ncbi:MAG: S9 family peptidase [Acidobacteriota bacterium]|nr:S9 family peptidase [Acidobacteriota bacterium]
MKVVWLTALAAAALSAQKAPFDAETLLKLVRVADPQVSPDGKTVAFSAVTIDSTANKKKSHLYLVPISGGPMREIADAGDSNERPRWSPDGKFVAYTSTRDGASQIWTVDSDGRNPRQLTHISTEAAGQIFSPDGKFLVFSSEVFPECGADDACNVKELERAKAAPTKARLITTLLYRHWTTWQGARRSHLLIIPAEGGSARDLTPGDRDVPPFALGGPEDYAISPDSKELVFAMNADEIPATSTNSDLFTVPLAVPKDGNAKPEKLTTNPAADSSPLYSPNGKYLAYRAQTRPGYESDRWQLVVLERKSGKLATMTDWLDRWVNSFTWSPDSQRIFFTAEDRGRQSIQYISVTGGGSKVAISGDNTLDDMQFTRDGKTIVFTRQSGAAPAEICSASAKGGPPLVLTNFNDGVLAEHQLAPYEEITTTGAAGAQVQTFLVKPANFDAKKKYPALLLIHGGPQGAWGQSWSYRWNPQVFASAGYVVAMVNPRGSTGFGQKFIDDINGDWGGKAYDDIMAAADKVSALPYVDGDRMAAAGGSYGGYMVDWILGHTTRFKALVSHAGVYDLRSMAGETEELWFPKWEFGGMPWETPEVYGKWSPSLFAKEFQTPTLVTHGELDFRVPFGQSLQLFTALQLQKIPSELLVFPDEGHWIQKPQNTLLWYKTFINWLDTWTKR